MEIAELTSDLSKANEQVILLTKLTQSMKKEDDIPETKIEEEGNNKGVIINNNFNSNVIAVIGKQEMATEIESPIINKNDATINEKERRSQINEVLQGEREVKNSQNIKYRK